MEVLCEASCPQALSQVQVVGGEGHRNTVQVVSKCNISFSS